MDNTLKRAIELCLAIYRITDKFPRGEVLSPKLRCLAIDIAECLIYNKALPTNSGRVFNLEDLKNKIRVLFAYFSIAEKQGWVDARNFRALEAAYRDFYRLKGGVKEHKAPRAEKRPLLSLRQEKILDFLRTNDAGRAISDIAGKIQTSNKTAERELKKLIGIRRVRKQGNTRGAKFIADT